MGVNFKGFHADVAGMVRDELEGGAAVGLGGNGGLGFAGVLYDGPASSAPAVRTDV